MGGIVLSVIVELNELVERINNQPDYIIGEKSRVYQFNLNESGIIQLHMKDGHVEVVRGNPIDPEVVLNLSDKNFSKLLKDDLNTTVAFMTGGLKIEGSIGLALKLQEIVRKYQKEAAL